MARPKKVVEPPNHGKYYEVKVTIGHQMDGTPIRKSFYSEVSKEDARRKAQDYITEQKIRNATGKGYHDTAVTFAVFAKKWLDSIRGTVKDNTYNLTYCNSVNNHLIPYFGNARISEIYQMDIQLYFSKMSTEKSLETLKKYKACLRGIFESAIDNQIISVSPVRNIKLSSSVQPIKKRVYTEEDVSRILSFALTHRFGLEIQMLLRLGLRRGELLGLRWEDVDLGNCILHIRRAVSEVTDPDTGRLHVIVDDPKTKFSVRDIPLPNDIATQLIHHHQTGTTSDYVFCNAKGNVNAPRTWSRRHYDVFMREMQNYYATLPEPIDITILNPHELRHTCASLLVNADKNLFAIASVLGWANLKMLRERYAHGDIESIREQLDL